MQTFRTKYERAGVIRSMKDFEVLLLIVGEVAQVLLDK